MGIDDKGFYDREFESHFLDATKVFYVTESTAFIEENGVSSYMQKAEGRIENEQNNAKQYLLASTEPSPASVVSRLVMTVSLCVSVMVWIPPPPPAPDPPQPTRARSNVRKMSPARDFTISVYDRCFGTEN